MTIAELRSWTDAAGVTRPVLVWSAPRLSRAVSSAIVGGGLGARSWWINAQVDEAYFHPDPAAHARQIAAGLGLRGEGVAMLTAADVARFGAALDGGVEVVATVGLGLPVPAASSEAAQAREGDAAGGGHRVGTINLLVVIPVPMSDAALVNAVITATEAKTQALVQARIPGTGTSSDAVCVVCPGHPTGADTALLPPLEPYGGPRSTWGARLARAVHATVAAGTADWQSRRAGGPRWSG